MNATRGTKSVQTRTERNTTGKKRVPIGAWRDILDIPGLQEAYPDYKFRWALDHSENGNRIVRLKMAGYELVTKKMLEEKNLEVGDDYVYNTADTGSLVRVPNGKQTDYLYLMRIPREWYEEDRKEKDTRTIDVEKQEKGPAGADYGSVEINRG